MNPSYGDKFEEYKVIGIAKLKSRAELVKKNKEFAEKIQSVKRLEIEKNKINRKRTCITRKVFTLNLQQQRTIKYA